MHPNTERFKVRRASSIVGKSRPVASSCDTRDDCSVSSGSASVYSVPSVQVSAKHMTPKAMMALQGSRSSEDRIPSDKSVRSVQSGILKSNTSPVLGGAKTLTSELSMLQQGPKMFRRSIPCLHRGIDQPSASYGPGLPKGARRAISTIAPLTKPRSGSFEREAPTITHRSERESKSTSPPGKKCTFVSPTRTAKLSRSLSFNAGHQQRPTLHPGITSLSSQVHASHNSASKSGDRQSCNNFPQKGRGSPSEVCRRCSKTKREIDELKNENQQLKLTVEKLVAMLHKPNDE